MIKPRFKIEFLNFVDIRHLFYYAGPTFLLFFILFYFFTLNVNLPIISWWQVFISGPGPHSLLKLLLVNVTFCFYKSNEVKLEGTYMIFKWWEGCFFIIPKALWESECRGKPRENPNAVFVICGLNHPL